MAALDRRRQRQRDSARAARHRTGRRDRTTPWGLSASATLRYIGNRWADEERQQTARGYTLLDVGLRYRRALAPGVGLDAFVTIENVANADWREAQFFFTSRLRGESAEGVPDIHYTPGNPRTVLGGGALRF